MSSGNPASEQTRAVALFARAGYAARGIVYLLVGGLAALAATDMGGQAEGSRGALKHLLTAPLGSVLLGAIAIGLVGYATWRTIQAVKDTDHHGLGVQGIVVRAALLFSALIHLLLANFVARLIFSLGGSSGDDNGGAESLASWLLQQPYGQWLVGAVGLVVMGVGIAHGVKGWRASFDRHFDMPVPLQRWTYPVCRFGLATRGIIFVIVGVFFIIAAYQVNPDQAGGMPEVFNALRRQSFGPWLLAFVATGLFAFGLYSLLEAFYRRVNPAS